MRITVDIPQSEAARLIRQVKAWQVRKRVQIMDLIEATAEEVAKGTRNAAPEDSGDLKKSVKTMLRDLADELSGYVVADKFYAKFIELGTQKAKAHPFMLPAYEAAVADFLVKLRRIVMS